MQILRVPPNPILIKWRDEEESKGNRVKAIKIQKLIEKRKLIDTQTGRFVNEYGSYIRG